MKPSVPNRRNAAEPVERLRELHSWLINEGWKGWAKTVADAIQLLSAPEAPAGETTEVVKPWTMRAAKEIREFEKSAGLYLIEELAEIIQKHAPHAPDKVRLLRVANGCHDYGGGYRDPKEAEIFHHGIQTVINALEACAKNPNDTQTLALERSAMQSAPKPPCSGTEEKL